MGGREEFDDARFQKRSAALREAWPTDMNIDGILLVAGKFSADAFSQQKTGAMHHWLLGHEFPETAVAILKEGSRCFGHARSRSRC